MQRLLARSYPSDLMRADTDARVELLLWINEAGVVERRKVTTSSDNLDLDRAAIAVAGEMRFDPAAIDNRLRAWWVTQWIAFQVRSRVAA